MGRRTWILGLLLVMTVAGCSSGKSEIQSAGSTTTTEATSSTATAEASATADSSATAEATGTKPAAKPQALQIAESGYSVVSGPRVEYAFYLRNPNKAYGAQFPMVDVVMRDSKGSVIGSSTVTFGRWLMPGETAAYAGEVDPRGLKPAKVTFEPVDPALAFKWKPAAEAWSEPAGVLKTKRHKATKTRGGVSFTGVVLKPPVIGVDEYLVSIILRDKAKRIVGGYTGSYDEILTGSEGPFKVDSVRSVPNFATFEVYAQRW